MSSLQKFSVFFLRITTGWLFFYAGLSHVLNPNFTAAGYLAGAKNFVSFYQWLASPSILPITNFVNEWALTLLGLSLILGIGVRLTGKLGALLMVLYWIPLGVLYPDVHSFIVDDHIIYAGALLLLSAINSGHIYGLDRWCSEKCPALKKIVG